MKTWNITLVIEVMAETDAQARAVAAAGWPEAKIIASVANFDSLRHRKEAGETIISEELCFYLDNSIQNSSEESLTLCAAANWLEVQYPQVVYCYTVARRLWHHRMFMEDASSLAHRLSDELSELIQQCGENATARDVLDIVDWFEEDSPRYSGE